MQPELAILVFGFYLTIGVGLVIWAFLFSGFVTQELFADFQELFAEFQELFAIIVDR